MVTGMQPVPIRPGLPSAAPQEPAWEPDPGFAPITAAGNFTTVGGAAPSLWRAFGDAAWTSTVNAGSDMVSAASAVTRALGGSPQAVAMLEKKRHALDDVVHDYVASLPAERQKTLHASLFGGETESGEPAPSPGEVGWTRYAAATLGSLLPTALLAIVPETLAGKVALKLGMSGGGQLLSRAATTGMVFGADQLGMAYKELVDGVDKASDTEMASNPAYAALRQQGMSEWQAKQELVGKAAPLLAAQFATGLATGGFITGGAAALAPKPLLARMGINAGAGAAEMGAQGGIGDALNQTAMGQAGPARHYDPSQTARAFAAGALGGAILGAGIGALPRGKPAAQPAIQAADTHTPDVQQALKETLQLTYEPRSEPNAGAAFAQQIQNQPLQLTYDAKTPVQPGQSPMDPVSVKYASGRPGEGAAPPQQAPQQTPVPPTVPEPRRDIDAQVAAMLDPNSAKDAVFLPKGTPLPGKLPTSVRVLQSKAGQLLTTNADKAKAFIKARSNKQITDEFIAGLLDYPQPKSEALAGGPTTVVQGRDTQGNVVHESVVTPDMVPQAAEVAASQAPVVATTTPEAAIARRVEQTQPETARDGWNQDANGQLTLTVDGQTYHVVRSGTDGQFVALNPTTRAVVTMRANADDLVAGLKEKIAQGHDEALVASSSAEPVAALGTTAQTVSKPVIAEPAPAPAKPKNKGELLREKRAAEKAKQAAPGERVRGAAAVMTAEDTTPHWIGKIQDAQSEYLEAKQRLLDSEKAAGRPDEAIIERMIAFEREAQKANPELFLDEKQLKAVAKALDDPASATPEQIRKAIRDTRPAEARTFEERIGSTKRTQSVEVEERLAEGDGRVDEDGVRRVVKEEKAEDRRADEEALAEQRKEEGEKPLDPDDPTTTVVDDQGGGSVSLVGNYDGGKGDRAASTTDLGRKLMDQVKAVLSGEKTAAEAHAEWGTRKTDVERHQTLPNYLRHLISEAAAQEAKLKELLLAKAAKGRTAAQRVADSKEINRLMALSDPERVKALREMLKEIEPGTAAAAERAKAVSEQRTTADAVAKHVGTIERIKDAPRLLRAMFAEERARPKNERSYLDYADEHGMGRAAWEAEHQFRTFGRGASDAERAAKYAEVSKMVEDVRRAEKRRAEEIYRGYGVTTADIDTFNEKLSRVPDKHWTKVKEALAAKYGPEPVKALRAALAEIEPQTKPAGQPEWYHGSTQAFTKFNVDKGDIGIHLGTRDQASGMGDKLYQVAFEPRKALRAEEPEHGGWANPKSAMDALERAGVAIPDAVKRQVETWDANTTVVSRGSEMSDRQRVLLGMLRRTVQKDGYDAIVYRNMHEGRERADSLIVLDPTALEMRSGSKGRVDRTQATRYRDTLDDPRLSKPIDDLLAKGEPRSIHDYLDAIMRDPNMRKHAAPMVALARRLKELLPRDLQVHEFDAVANRFEDARHASEMAGMYFPATRDKPAAIGLRRGANAGKLETLLHEALHAVTARYIEEFRPRELDIIQTELRRILDRGDLSRAERYEVEYALSDVHELHTMLMTNATMQRLAAELTPTRGFVQDMARRGYSPQSLVKSVWSYFTEFLKRAIGITKGREAKAIDYIMRPLQDIVDEAHAFNKLVDGVRPRDPMARAMPDFGQMRERTTRWLDPKGVKFSALRGVLQGMPTDHIVRGFSRTFEEGEGRNGLRAWRDADEARGARTARHIADYADRVRDLVADYKGPERDQLARLLVDATLADVKLGPTVVAKDAAHQALLDRYKALSPKTRGAYDETIKLGNEQYAMVRDAQFNALLKNVLPDATPDQLKALNEAVRTRGGIDALLKDTDTSDVAAAFGDAWVRRKKLVRGIAQLHRMGYVQGDYFPLRRYGDYVLRYGEKGTDGYGMEMFERVSEAEARRDALLAEGVDVSGVMLHNDRRLRHEMPTTVADDLYDAMRRDPALAKHADAAQDLMLQIQMQHATRTEGVRNRLRREGVQGASTEIEKIVSREFLSTATRLGYLEHGAARYEAIEQMRRHAGYLGRTTSDGSQLRAMSVIHELEQRMPNDDSPGRFTGAARRLTGLGYVNSLMSFSHILMGTIDVHSNSLAMLSARHKMPATLALTKALADIAPKLTAAGVRNTISGFRGQLKMRDWHLSEVVRDRLIEAGADKAAMHKLFNRLDDAGLIDHSFARDLERMTNPQADIAKGFWQRFMDTNAAMSHAVDVANKSAVAKAAFDLEFRKTHDMDASIDYAVETVRRVAPNYASKARIGTAQGSLGGMGAPLMQFRNYGLHMYSMLGVMMKEALDKTPSAQRSEARRAFAGILFSHALAAGSISLIADPLRYIMGAYDWLSGEERPRDYQSDIRGWMTDTFGPELGEAIARGVPNAVGMDIHKRVGLADMLSVPELKSFDKKGFVDMMYTAITGAGIQDAVGIAEGVTKMVRGDIWEGSKLIVPRVIRDAMKARDMASVGVTDQNGKTILPAEKLSGLDLAYQAIGIQPSRVSEFREARNAVIDARLAANGEKSRILLDLIKDTGGDREALVERVRDYNRRYPAMAITYGQMLQALHRERTRMRGVNAGNTYGLTLGKKQMGLAAEGSFANVQ